MKIERVYTETELQTLEKGIVESTAVVERWRANLNSINTQIADAQARLAKAAAHRKEFALHAKLGNAQASADLAKARAEQAIAEADLKDLSVALDGTNQQLHEAEAEAAKASRALARFEAEGLKRKRVHLAGKIDDAIAEFARLLAEFESLGEDIANIEPAPANLHGMPATNHDAAIGWRRLRAAMPAFIQKLYPGSHHDEMPKMDLKTAESRFWNLAPVETNSTSKAA